MRPVPERLAAKAAGEKRYNTGRPCKNGHLCDRFTCNGRCVECDKGIVARYHASHPGEEARWARERRAKDPTGHRAEVKRWAQKNRERKADYMRAWKRSKGAQYHRDAHKRWREANIEYVRAYNAAKTRIRCGLKGVNGGSYTEADIVAIRLRQGDCCAACRRSGVKLEVDHIIAITRGGTNGPANIQLLCRSCNASKYNKDFAEWTHLMGYPVQPFAELVTLSETQS